MTVIATKTISAPCPRVVAEGSQLGNASNPTACGAASFRATEIGDSIVVVTVSGEVDLSSADGLREFTLSRIDDRRDLVLDLSAVDFCGTATLAVFSAVDLAVRDRGRSWVIATNRAVFRMLRVVRQRGLFPCADSFDTALASLRAS